MSCVMSWVEVKSCVVRALQASYCHDVKFSALEITKLENLDRWFKGLARALTMSRVMSQHSSNYYAIVNFS